VKGFATAYRLTLDAPEDDGIPPAIRLRHCLKRAWRSDRLRCRKVEQLAIGGEWGPPDGSLPLEHGAGI
jgi:hypothetical protein